VRPALLFVACCTELLLVSIGMQVGKRSFVKAQKIFDLAR
jgi:hypothetical protein